MTKLQLIYHIALMSSFNVLPGALQSGPLAQRARSRFDRQITETLADFVRDHNGSLFQDTPDRLVLETRILPFYQLSPQHNKIVFVGCDWYTEAYTRLFAHKTYVTIEPDAQRAKHGAARHQIGPMRTMGGAVKDGSVDAIICNGVIGWGLDTVAEADASFAAAWQALRPGGHLIVGFNDRPPHNPYRLDEVPSLSRFAPLTFPPLDASEHRVAGELQHVYRFYTKPD